jgi:hypothetical protein
MEGMFNVRVPPSRVLLLLRHHVVVGRPQSPRSDITAHATRPPVPRCAVDSLCLQSAHRWMGRELGDEHVWHVLCTCSSIPCCFCCVAVVVVRPPSPRSDITAHSTRPPVPCCAAVCYPLQSGHQHVVRPTDFGGARWFRQQFCTPIVYGVPAAMGGKLFRVKTARDQPP